MKNTLLTLILFAACVNLSLGQEGHTIDGASGILIIQEVNKVTLIGTDENRITMELENGENAISEKAKGLRLINADGLVDNTGIGLYVKSDGDTHTVQGVSNRAGKRYIFKVPSGYQVQYESNSNNGGKLISEDCTAELDVSVRYNSVQLNGITGPVAIHSVYGSISADFASVSQNGPISIYSVYADVDVSVPTNARADFQLRASHGDVYSDLDLKYPESQDGMKNLSSKKFIVKSNGGGTEFKIKSGYANVYLRSK